MQEQQLINATVKLWEIAVEAELVDDLEPETVLGAHYAKITQDSIVKLTPTGLAKVQAAYTALHDLLEEHNEDEETEDEDEEEDN